MVCNVSVCNLSVREQEGGAAGGADELGIIWALDEQKKSVTEFRKERQSRNISVDSLEMSVACECQQ